MEPILIDRGQFVSECLIQELDDLFIANSRLASEKPKKWQNSATCERFALAEIQAAAGT